ncbi:hypothetical protein [uncultured Croceitalea sp.]|uniref:hypothetical protein n=1 Tax=uncultured Croceitalea sp. TaxID=1798908 RepID=UPI0033063692
MEKNNLEKLYQEKLKDFREIPDEKVWESIAASLDKKKKKRVVPIWWKLGGVAALLALLFYVVNPFEENIPINETTDIENPTNEKLDEVNSNQKLANDTINQIKNANTIRVAETEENKEDSIINEIPLATSDSNKKDTPNIPEDKNEGIAVANKGQNDKQGQKVKNKALTVIAENKNLTKKDTQDNKTQMDFKKSLENSKTGAVVVSDAKDEKNKVISNQKEGIENQLSNKKDAVAETTIKDNEIKDGKKSIFEAIKEQKEEDIAIAESKENKWSVGPSIAPVYFDAVGEGSPIHSNFVENSKSGNINLSYGLTVAYNLGKRLKVRSGIHKVDYGYDTNEVVFSSSIAANSTGTIDNINFSQTSRTIVVQSKKANENALDSPSSNDFSAQSSQRDGRMSQQLGYLEVPLELNYTLVDKKIGINLIGGVSSLFLVDNSVSLQSEGLVTEIGEANNVNSVNFSTNFGVGFNYKFSPKVQLNLEPVFKYQLNTFSETAGNFNPYSLGVYSGVRFSF